MPPELAVRDWSRSGDQCVFPSPTLTHPKSRLGANWYCEMTEVAGLREWGVKAPRLSVVCVRKEGDRQKFNRLRNEWKEATGHLSSIEDIAMNYAYQQIIGMGERALRFIFEELARQPDHWFWALRAISGEDPVPQGHWGDLRAMTDDWLNWAKNTDHGVSSKVDSVVSGVEGWLRDYEPGNSRV